MRAASELVVITRSDRPVQNILVYPIMFNYRHALELAMKWTIDQYGCLAGVSLTSDNRKQSFWSVQKLCSRADNRDHNLLNLWSLCKEVITRAGSEGDDENLQVVGQIVKDFHDIDKSGQAFRYAATKTGKLLQLRPSDVDLENVRVVMEGVDNFFSGVDGLLSELTQAG